MLSFCAFDTEIRDNISQTARELNLKTDGEAFNYPHRMRLSVGVVYNSETKEYIPFESAAEMAKYLLTHGDFLVSFNGRRFDIPLLLSDCDIDTFLALQHKPHMDMLADFYLSVQGRFRVSLNNVAVNTLKKSKNGSGADAPRLFQEGKITELVHYCQMDVELTKEVFEFGAAMGYIMYYDSNQGKVVEMKVDYADWLVEKDGN